MITGELSWAWIALSFAWSGSGVWPFADSYLHAALDKRDLDWVWSVFVGAPAALLLIFSAREWLSHCSQRVGLARQWTIFQLERSAMVRGRLCLALVFSWLYVFYVISTSPSSRPSAITPVAAGGAFFMLMFWLENRRVQRDIRKHTASFIVPT